ncbi:MAG: YdiU family protein [Desulfobulbaceae bacterium]|nr:YdiU family protein [Desulfobulbaceae bacterium]
MNMPLRDQTLESLVFDNSFVEKLPADLQPDNFRRPVSKACYSRVEPTKVSAPQLVAHSREVADLLNLSEETCNSSLFTEIFAGNSLLSGMDPFAMCYGGHQFGNWAGQLGDGRAINLGEVINSEKKRWMLQLKGAGPTPYSRQADGLAVLRSSIREFLCSEAMHHLGIPTTRALSVINTGELVLRDMFYDGHPKNEPGAVVCRVAPSFLRFGNFEILASRGETDLLKKLVDYTIRTDFPHLGEPSATSYIEWFKEICQTTAAMIIHWMRVGFVHGVMNTDNMSVLGLTIDYGPYGWLEGYEAQWTPNTTDAHGRRYSYSNQPHIGQWNLLQLANAIYPLVKDAEPFKEALSYYNALFLKGWNDMLAAKLGFKTFMAETDDTLIGELVDILQLVETDMTIFFRKLASISTNIKMQSGDELPTAICEAYYKPEEITKEYKHRMNNWLQSYVKRLQHDALPDELKRQKMNSTNPKYVLRNYLAQLAIDKAENGDFSMVGELLELFRNPYDEQPAKDHYAVKRPEWARNRAGCSMLSCSS